MLVNGLLPLSTLSLLFFVVVVVVKSFPGTWK